MAKDKEFEKDYLTEKLRRTKIRKANRREKRLEKKARYGGVCPCCGRSIDDCLWDDDDW